jgi:hypothetical protein
MEKELNHGTTILYNMMEILKMEKRLAKESLNSVEMFMKAILLMDNFMEKASIYLQRVNLFMKETFITITSLVKEK